MKFIEKKEDEQKRNLLKRKIKKKGVEGPFSLMRVMILRRSFLRDTLLSNRAGVV